MSLVLEWVSSLEVCFASGEVCLPCYCGPVWRCCQGYWDPCCSFFDLCNRSLCESEVASCCRLDASCWVQECWICLEFACLMCSTAAVSCRLVRPALEAVAVLEMKRGCSIRSCFDKKETGSCFGSRNASCEWLAIAQVLAGPPPVHDSWAWSFWVWCWCLSVYSSSRQAQRLSERRICWYWVCSMLTSQVWIQNAWSGDLRCAQRCWSLQIASYPQVWRL